MKKVYIADKSQLVMSGIHTILRDDFSDVIPSGYSSLQEKILADIDTGRPDILFVDEEIMYNRELPLIVLVSFMYPELLIIALTNNKRPKYNKFSDFYLSKPLLTPKMLASMMKELEKCSPRYNFETKEFDYLFLLMVHKMTKEDKIFSKRILPFIPMSITLDTVPLSEKTSIYIFHFMENSYEEMEDFKTTISGYTHQRSENLLHKESDILTRSSGLNQKVTSFLIKSTEKFINNNSDIKNSIFNLEEYQTLLDNNELDRALKLLTYYINRNEELNLESLLHNSKKFIKIFMKYLNSDMIKSKIKYFINIMPKDNYENFKSIYLKIREQIKFYLNQNKSIQTEEELMNGIIDYIDAYYYNNLTIHSIAVHFQFEGTYLTGIIVKYLKMPLKAYVYHIRVKNAAVMLVNTNYSVAEICRKVGYVNQTYFEQIFVGHKGCTLKKYRENHIIKTKKDKKGYIELSGS